MNYSSSYMPSDMVSLLTLGFASIVYLTILLVSIVCIIITFIVTNIPLYRMAKRAGIKNAWLAFIPLGCVYIRIMIPRREYNIFNLFKTDDRKKAFLLHVILFVIIMVVDIFCTMLSFIPIVGLILILILIPVLFIFGIAISIILWRANYDILMTYGMEEHAMLISIISIFFPILMIIFSYIIMNREPDYSI